MNRSNILSFVLLLSICATGAIAQEDAGTWSPPQSLTSLPSVPNLPDVFTFADGRKVETREDWDRRREELKAAFGATVTHLIAAACVRALVDVPDANRSYDRGKIIKWKGVNLGIAVATDEGLTVAVVRNAQGLSFEQLVGRSKEMCRAAAGFSDMAAA